MFYNLIDIQKCKHQLAALVNYQNSHFQKTELQDEEFGDVLGKYMRINQ